MCLQADASVALQTGCQLGQGRCLCTAVAHRSPGRVRRRNSLQISMPLDAGPSQNASRPVVPPPGVRSLLKLSGFRRRQGMRSTRDPPVRRLCSRPRSMRPARSLRTCCTSLRSGSPPRSELHLFRGSGSQAKRNCRRSPRQSQVVMEQLAVINGRGFWPHQLRAAFSDGAQFSGACFHNHSCRLHPRRH